MRFAFFLACLLGGCAAVWGKSRFTDGFSQGSGGECVPDGGRVGRWTVVSTGFGCVKTDGEGGERWLHAGTSPSGSPGETHAALLTGPVFSAPFSFTVRVNTIEQTRTGAPPNDWEAAWLVWGYADRKHFYYLVVKPKGWELGKRDPAYPGGQRYLVDGRAPAFPLGTWATIRITQDEDARIEIHADGRLVTAFTDVQRPYAKGKIALYLEDSVVRFDDVSAASD